MAESSASARARRLLTLVPFLAEKRVVPLAELARSVGSTEEQLAEDLSVLSLCGSDERDPSQLVGVLVEDGVAEVFADLPALERPVRLTHDEARALLTAMQAIGADGNHALVAKLADFAGRTVTPEEIASTVREAFAPGGQAQVLAALSMAAEQRIAVRVGYVTAGAGVERERVLHPFVLYRWRDAWYLSAYCETSQMRRTFRVDRITSVHSTGEHFDVPAGEIIEPVPLPDLRSLPRATVRFAADAPDLNDRDWPGATFERAADGSVTASVPYAGTTWIARGVVARLGDAEVVAPSDVRAAVAAAARDMLEAL